MVMNLPRSTGWGTQQVAAAVGRRREREDKTARQKMQFMSQAILKNAEQGIYPEEAQLTIEKEYGPGISSMLSQRATRAKEKRNLEMETMKITKKLTAQKILTLKKKEFFSLLDRMGPNDPSVKLKAEEVNKTAKILGHSFTINFALTNAQNKQKAADAQAKELFDQIRDIKLGGKPEENRLKMIGIRQVFDEFKQNNQTHENVSTIEAAIKRQQALIDAATKRQQVVSDKKSAATAKSKAAQATAINLESNIRGRQKVEMFKDGRSIKVTRNREDEFLKAGWKHGTKKVPLKPRGELTENAVIGEFDKTALDKGEPALKNTMYKHYRKLRLKGLSREAAFNQTQQKFIVGNDVSTPPPKTGGYSGLWK